MLRWAASLSRNERLSKLVDPTETKLSSITSAFMWPVLRPTLRCQPSQEVRASEGRVGPDRKVSLQSAHQSHRSNR